MTPILHNTIWFAVQDTQILERVHILDIVYFPTYGRYILYRLIDWPDSGNPHPNCVHEDTFRLLYTPQDELPCENPPTESYTSKTFSQPRPFWSTVARGLWRRVTLKNNNFW